MRKVLSALRFIGLILFLVLLTVALNYLLPSPWNKFSVPLSAAVIFMLWTESGLVVWISFAVHLILELYSASPFGIMVFAGTLSTLFGVWLYRGVFTNRSWYTALALTALLVIFYRGLFLLGLIFVNLIGAVPNVPWLSLLIIFVWEMILTSLVTTSILFLLFSLAGKSRRPPASA